MSNVIAQGSAPVSSLTFSEYSLKLGNNSNFTLGVSNTSYAIAYKFWKIEIYQKREMDLLTNNNLSMMNVYFLQNSITQSVVDCTAVGPYSNGEPSNLLIEDSSIWTYAYNGSIEPVALGFSFPKPITIDEIKWRTSSLSIGSDPTQFTIWGSNFDDDGKWPDLTVVDWKYHRSVFYENLTETRSAVVDDAKIDEFVFFNTITPPTGGYTIYSIKERGGPSITTAASDSELISYCQANARVEISNLPDCFDAMIQDNMETPTACLSFVHETITLQDCVIAVDASMPMSFPRYEIGSLPLGKTKFWYNMREYFDADNMPLNLEFEPDKYGTYPGTVSTPGKGKISIQFIGSSQSAIFYGYTDKGNRGQYPSITVEMYCKFLDTFPNGTIFGFDMYRVNCDTGYIGFSTSNNDLYGFTASGVTGSYQHLICTFYSESDSYTNNKIYVNGVEKSLFQQKGQEEPTNRKFNGGKGKIASSFSSKTPAPVDLPLEVQVFRLYKRVLTASEVAINYAAFQSRFDLS